MKKDAFERSGTVVNIRRNLIGGGYELFVSSACSALSFPVYSTLEFLFRAVHFPGGIGILREPLSLPTIPAPFVEFSVRVAATLGTPALRAAGRRFTGVSTISRLVAVRFWCSSVFAYGHSRRLRSMQLSFTHPVQEMLNEPILPLLLLRLDNLVPLFRNVLIFVVC